MLGGSKGRNEIGCTLDELICQPLVFYEFIRKSHEILFFLILFALEATKSVQGFGLLPEEQIYVDYSNLLKAKK